MSMSTRLSKFVLVSHITFSVGWLGAVAVFLALAVAGVTTADTQVARSAYLAMELSAWTVIVPFCLASLISGIAQALGTRWGLFKHYWIAVKLLLTIAASVLLLLHMGPIGFLAGLAADTTFPSTEQTGLRIQLIAQAGGALIVLLLATTLSVYKPWGRIRYGLQGNSGGVVEVQGKAVRAMGSWRTYLWIGIIGAVIALIAKHLLGNSMGHF